MSAVAWLFVIGGVLLLPVAVILLVNVAVRLWETLNDYEARAILTFNLVAFAGLAGAVCLIVALVMAVAS